MRNLAGTLTNATGSLVDFYNLGGLAIQRTKNSLWGLWTYYSWRELAIRASLLTATVLCAAVAANTCEDEQCSSLLRGTGGAAFGFFVGHAVAMAPTLKRRLKLKNDAYEFQDQTRELLVALKTTDVENTQQIEDISEHINQFCTYLKNLSLPVTKRGDGILNLVKIKGASRAAYRQLNELVTVLEHSEEHERTQLLEEALRFWAQDHKSLFNELINKKEDAAVTYSSPKM
ncbi:hypothetical protein [Legionella rowbothamii]|uniref:hypothetical protein n=1 Tax=Legionella rowbothamii TaxID=96229 RepID=UPI001055B031|nr:hypothetical protein [Legionella rowbothamii]